jgi:transcriptional repressor NrdR
MRCPFCGSMEGKVIDSRATEEGNSIRRRRECQDCNRRFTTYEVVEEVPLLVVKKDGRRVLFDRNKLLQGVAKSCEKRPIAIAEIEALVGRVEREISNSMVREVASEKIGEMVMLQLKDLDQVAYVRFASVYRQFADIQNFMQELEILMRGKTNQEAAR